MQYLVHTYAKKLFIVYLKFEFKWTFYTFVCQICWLYPVFPDLAMGLHHCGWEGSSETTWSRLQEACHLLLSGQMVNSFLSSQPRPATPSPPGILSVLPTLICRIEEISLWDLRVSPISVFQRNHNYFSQKNWGPLLLGTQTLEAHSLSPGIPLIIDRL